MEPLSRRRLPSRIRTSTLSCVKEEGGENAFIYICLLAGCFFFSPTHQPASSFRISCGSAAALERLRGRGRCKLERWVRKSVVWCGLPGPCYCRSRHSPRPYSQGRQRARSGESPVDRKSPPRGPSLTFPLRSSSSPPAGTRWTAGRGGRAVLLSCVYIT